MKCIKEKSSLKYNSRIIAINLNPMKKILFLYILITFNISCNIKSGNGFVNESDLSFHMGSDNAVELFKSFDFAWKNLDYNLMKTMIADSISFEFQDGKVATNAQEFIDLVKKEVEKEKESGNNYSWTTDFAFSVDLNPKSGGEWVTAGFTSNLDNPEDGVIKKEYNEWYFFNKENKLELWYQTIRKVKE